MFLDAAENTGMTKPTVYGFPQSTYVRTVRLACEEKSIDYELVPTGFSSEGLSDLNPFRRIPAFCHGAFSLYETSAICRYIDAAFDGPSLIPADSKAQARMEQWISVVNAYIDPPVIRDIVIERITRPLQNRPVDEEKCRDAKPRAAHALGVIEAALDGNEFLAGDSISLADFFLLPILYYFRDLPEGKEILSDLPRLGNWYQRMHERPSFTATQPPPPGER
jgi:glutathione S-transferase